MTPSAFLMIFLNQIFFHPTADVALDQGTEAVPSSSVLPASCNERKFAVESYEKQYRETRGRNPRVQLCLWRRLQPPRSQRGNKNNHCTWIKTSGTRGKVSGQSLCFKYR